MDLVWGQLNLMVTVWGHKQAEERALRNVSQTLSPGGAGADVFTWMLKVSIQYFAGTYMYNPVSQPRVPAKEGNEVRVAMQVLWHFFPSTRGPQIMTLVIWTDIKPSLFLGILSFFKVFWRYGLGRSILFMGALLSPGCRLARQGGLGTQISLSLFRLILPSSLTTWSDSGLFCPLQSEGENWSTRGRTQESISQCHSQHIIFRFRQPVGIILRYSSLIHFLEETQNYMTLKACESGEGCLQSTSISHISSHLSLTAATPASAQSLQVFSPHFGDPSWHTLWLN